jgi:hypothetical protein
LPDSQPSDASEIIETQTKGNSLEDRVMVNKAFTSNLVRLTLPIPALEEVYKKEKVVQERT